MVLGELLELFIDYKIQVVEKGFEDKSRPVTLFIDEAHWYQDVYQIPEVLKWLSTSGRRYGLFSCSITQRTQGFNTFIRREALWIIGFLRYGDYIFTIDELNIRFPKAKFKSFEFYFVNDPFNSLDKIKVHLQKEG